MNLLKPLLVSYLLIFSSVSISKDFGTKISMVDKGALTYYVASQVKGYNSSDFMIDTGSGYTAINETMLNKLRQQNNAEFLNTVSGIMANGKRTTLSVYRIDSINIGGKCIVENIKAVVLPGDTRNILGLNALKKAAPFAMSMNPPELILSNCKA